MKMEANFEVPVDDQIVVFAKHIDDPQNERIIFSGIFGIGKSYFLERFFENTNDKYVPIKLSPVNYSISSNEDIFRLLKYDILYELIVTHELELEQEVIERHIAYGTILSSKTGSLLENFLSAAQLLNKGIGSGEDLPNPTPFINFLSRIAPKIEAIEKVRKDANLNQRILSFISGQESSVMFESDFVTGFIIESLQQLAGSEQKKQTVLVIDDLDRIDPEHIFRLFNIFSSHLNYRKSTGNKFGFDKVIFVCDIENIRNIFSARYGESTDFSGYIDKFYSSEIFHFNNNSAVVAFTDKIVSNVKFDNNSIYAASLLKNLEHGDKALLSFFIRTGINSGTLSLRKLISILKRQYNIDNRSLPLLPYKQQVINTSFPAVVALEVMNEFYGGVALFRKALQKMNSFKKSRHTNFMGYSQTTDDQNILGYFIPVLDYKQHNFKLSQSGDTVNALEYDFKGQKIKYELITFNQLSHQYYGRVFTHNDVNYSFIVIDVILATLDHLVELDYFKI